MHIEYRGIRHTSIIISDHSSSGKYIYEDKWINVNELLLTDSRTSELMITNHENQCINVDELIAVKLII